MTTLGRNILVWVFRHLLALVLIIFVLIAGRYVVPPAAAWLSAQAETARSVSAQRSALSAARERFDAWAAVRRGEIDARSAALVRSPEGGLRARRAEIERSIAAQRQARLGRAQLALAAAAGNSDRIFGHYRAGAEIALLERELGLVDTLLAARTARGREADLATRRRQAMLELRASHARWRAAADRVDSYNRRPLAGARNLLCRTTRPRIGCTNYRALEAARAERDAALADNRRARATIALIDRRVRAVGAARAQAAAASTVFDEQRRALAVRAAELRRAARGNWILWIRQPVIEVLPTALLILAGVIFGPLLIKAVLYFLVAPAAARRPPIRLIPDELGEARLEGECSSASQRVELVPGQELLVVPEALQSTPHEAGKATQWLLDWSMPLSSLASGMVALVRIRPRRADFVRLAATGDPLAEIALVTIPEGSAMVLRPRALRGLVQPLGRPVRIGRHWRLASLSSWLTLQLRYLIFHGPCLAVVQGRRGVRLEPAAEGRGVNQAATIGFSAGAAYSVRRSEAFGAYLMGRQELFNDSFESPAGHYLYEQMPREGVRGGPWGRGISGLGDALLKVVGL